MVHHHQNIHSVVEHYDEMTYDELFTYSRSLQANSIECFFLVPIIWAIN